MLWPLQPLPPLLSLAIVSLIVAAGLLLLFKYTSDQRALGETKRQIRAGLLELRLFQDSPRVMRRAVATLLRQQSRYLRLAIVPTMWALVPLALLLSHLQTYYGYDGLPPAGQALVTVRLAPSAVTRDVRPALRLEAPPGVRVETPCVWAPALREGAWRIAAERPGQYDLRVNSGGTGATKRVVVSTAVAARTPRRPAPALWDEFLNPGEPPLFAAAPIESIEVRYPARALGVLGFTMPWIVAFFILTSVFMVAGRSLVNVVL